MSEFDLSEIYAYNRQDAKSAKVRKTGKAHAKAQRHRRWNRGDTPSCAVALRRAGGEDSEKNANQK